MTNETIAEKLVLKKNAMAFSSGFFGFYHHAGALKAFTDHKIFPKKLSGTSAGSIVAALYGAGLSAENICDALLKITRKDFWDFQFPFTYNGFGWLKGERFGKILDNMLPVKQFKECKIPTSVGVYTLKDGRSRQLNQGSIVNAVRASCAVPYLFSPVKIDNELYWDGGFAEKTPLGHYVKDKEIDSVIISHMPPREEHGGKKRKQGLFSGIKFFADIPLEERINRDKVAVKLIRKNGKKVYIFSPKRLWLGPFSLDKAQEAMEFGYNETVKMLNSTDLNILGSDNLK